MIVLLCIIVINIINYFIIVCVDMRNYAHDCDHEYHEPHVQGRTWLKLQPDSFHTTPIARRRSLGTCQRGKGAADKYSSHL